MTSNDIFYSDQIKHFDRLDESFAKVNQDSNILAGGYAFNRNKLLYDHTKFNKAIEILVKMLDRRDHFDRIFAQ